MPAFSPIIILDAGPLIAALNARDEAHRWARDEMLRRPGPFIATSAAVAEATHALNNSPVLLGALRVLVERIQIEDPAPVEVLAEMIRWKSRMDYADACAVILARRHPGSVVLTTDHRDFSIFRVPFVSPRGEFRP